MPWCAACVLAVLLSVTGARADSATEDGVKVGFILNFAKYTQWPAASLSGAELQLCSLSAAPLSGKLELLRGRKAQGRSIQVRAPVALDDMHGCQVLFLASTDAMSGDVLLRSLAAQPVLTISDAAHFANAGGVIGLKVRDGRIRFDINQTAAHHAGLKLSSQLLKLADDVVQ